MKPIFQTRFGSRQSEDDVGGNCFQAALASLFELELAEVPDFCNIYPLEGDEWWYAYVEWLNARGLSVVPINLKASRSISLLDREFRNCILLVQGPNKDGVQHCVVYKNGKPLHNPNPHCKGITPEFVDVIFPLNLAGGDKE